MVLDGISLKKIVAELNTCLIGGKVNKVFTPNKNELLLSIYCSGKQYALAVSVASDCYYFNLTTQAKPNPLKASNFCMFLRKHLIGFRISQIKMNGLERVVFVHFTGYNEMNDLTEKILVIELMGKHSNIILLNQNQTIMDALRHLDSDSGSNRNILPAHPYTLPDSEKVDLSSFTTKQDFLSFFQDKVNDSFVSLEQLIPQFLTGISKNYIQETIKHHSITAQITQANLLTIYEALTEEMQQIQKVESSLVPITTFNFLCDDFFSEKEEKQIFHSMQLNLVRLVSDDLKKLRNRLNHMEEKLKACEDMERYRLYGELLTSNLYRFKGERLNDVTLLNYYENQELTIPLEDRFDVSENARRYFKKYTKLKNASDIVEKQKIETLKELDYLGSILYEIESATTLEDLTIVYEEMASNLVSQKKKVAPSKFTVKGKKENSYLNFTIDGYTVLVGKNNMQNDILTLKEARKTDYWFHTKQIHGSHVILKLHAPDETPPPDTLVKCAKLAAKYSKAKYSSNVPVDYTQVKFVKKPSGAKPGMVIYTNYKTIHVTNEIEKNRN